MCVYIYRERETTYTYIYAMRYHNRQITHFYIYCFPKIINKKSSLKLIMISLSHLIHFTNFPEGSGCDLLLSHSRDEKELP